MLLNKLIIRTTLKPILWMQRLSTRSNSVRSRTNYEISVKKRQRMMARDKVDDSYVPIYNAPAGLAFRIGYPIGLLCAIAGPSIYLYKFGLKNPDIKGTLPFRIEYTANNRDLYSLIACSILCTCAFIAVVIKYPYRVYKHKDKMQYIAIYQGIIPFSTYQFHFSKACETKFKNPLYFFVDDGQFMLGGKKAILMPYHFRTSYDLCQMIGVK